MPPYLLNNRPAYQAWREQKLHGFPNRISELIVGLNDPLKLTDEDIGTLENCCARANMVIYRCAEDVDPKKSIIALARKLGLQQPDATICAGEDCISAIENTRPRPSRYIPYTNQALNWHTDGYYNPEQKRIHAFLMHCVRPAKSGGENTYLDPEIAYILLRDESPDYIQALMQDDVMLIPANEVDHRSAQSGPVFYLDHSENLCMRYTARQGNIEWKKDKRVANALACLNEILQDNPYMFRYRLSAKEGVICNNVLHNRTAYEDDAQQKRLLYRSRFYRRVHSSSRALKTMVNQ